MAKEPRAETGAVVVGDTVVPFGSSPLPIVYFDEAPSFSHMNGVIGVTLTAAGNVPDAKGGVVNCVSVAAFLKCNIPAAMALRAALDGALLLAQPVENPKGKSN